MTKGTIYNHINPQSLLSFWANKKGRLSTFNKCSLQYCPNQSASRVCGKKHFLPQWLEDLFANYYDGKIKKVVKRICESKEINLDDRLFLTNFLVSQTMRNPFYRNIIEQLFQKYIPSSYDGKSLDLMFDAVIIGGKNLAEWYFTRRWRLLEFPQRVLVTNEVLITPQLVDENVMYFPITPNFCIALSNTKIDYTIDKKLVNHINNLIARMPETNWIVFDEAYDPMMEIELFDNGQKIWPANVR